ncbi:hypothetical protein HDU76_011535 [Blyttiomyces sp. JEL0837]|nr:hypothetical protein HDU76_011535 [Blyttiomyces sp. JEL0837]
MMQVHYLVPLYCILAFTTRVADAGGIWGGVPSSISDLGGGVNGTIVGYDPVGAYDFQNRTLGWADCIGWAKTFSNQIHAISWDSATKLCALKQFLYINGYQTTFGGYSAVLMYNAFVDDQRFKLGSFENARYSYDQCNNYCDIDPLCFSAEYDTVNQFCYTRQLLKSNPTVIFTLPWWNKFPQENAAPKLPPSTTSGPVNTSTVVIPNQNTPRPSSSSSSSVPIAAIAGGVAGGLVVVIAGVVLIVYYMRRGNNKQNGGLVVVDRGGNVAGKSSVNTDYTLPVSGGSYMQNHDNQQLPPKAGNSVYLPVPTTVPYNLQNAPSTNTSSPAQPFQTTPSSPTSPLIPPPRNPQNDYSQRGIQFPADRKISPLFDNANVNQNNNDKTGFMQSGTVADDLSLEIGLQNQLGPYYKWSCNDVVTWAGQKQLPRELVDLLKAKQIDGSILHTLDRDSIKNDLGIYDIGLRARLLKGIEMLRESQPRGSGFVGGVGVGGATGVGAGDVLPPSYPVNFP